MRVAIIKSVGVPEQLSADVVDGGTLNFLECLQAYERQGWAIDVFTSSTGAETRRERHGSAVVHRLPVACEPSALPQLIDRDFEQASRFAQALIGDAEFAAGTFQLWHTHHWSSALMPVLQHRGNETTHIHTPHLLLAVRRELTRESPTSPALVHEAAVIRGAHQVIALSAHEKQQVHHYYGKAMSGITVIPNGVSGEFFLSGRQRTAASDGFRLLTVARIARQKGLHALLEAVDRIRRTRPVQVTIIGGPYRHETAHWDSLRALHAALHLQGTVTFAGTGTRAQIANELARSDVYVQPSLYESQGIAILEAMAAGVPVVASRLGAVEEYMTDGVSGLLVPVGSSEELASAIERLLSDAALRRTLAATARGIAERFTWEEMRRVLIRCVEAAITSRETLE
ncbi:MAG: D-inositol-3-phosphate glycosyltransferase [Acidobacteriota bacterium]|jgi:D-inositol-3-phosphate glycosyltransferase|nr:D-inositol-3-phosphate glycosyltransferase [Acidobacteriota bacterium]